MKTKATNQRAPIHRASGFNLESLKMARKAFKYIKDKPEQKKYLADPIYTRYGNPTVRSTEDVIAKMEGCKWVLLTSSGMSA